MVVIRPLFALLAFLAAAVFPGTLPAQATTAARDSAIARLRTGQQIRLAAAGLGRLDGRAGVSAGDSLDLAQGDAVRRIPVPAIDTLWVLGSSWRTGAVIGGIVGGALGSLAVVAAAGACEYECGSTAGQAVGGFVLGAVVGVPLGALIGGRFPKWNRRFP